MLSVLAMNDSDIKSLEIQLVNKIEQENSESLNNKIKAYYHQIYQSQTVS